MEEKTTLATQINDQESELRSFHLLQKQFQLSQAIAMRALTFNPLRTQA